MADSILAVLFREIFTEFGKVIFYIILGVIVAILLALFLLAIFSGVNVIAAFKKNKTKGIILSILFVGSIILLFNKNPFPLILLSIYFVIDLIISLVKLIIKGIKKLKKKK